MAFHCVLTGDDIHVINTWTYANSAARAAATGFIVDDVYKVAVQEDDYSVWILINHSPITWMQLGGVVVGLIDHCALSPSSLLVDCHTQYMPVNASRSFTAPVSGQNPTLNNHLTTKIYVDTQDAGVLVAANAYSDAADSATLSAAEAYADAGDTATLSAANSYSDAASANALAQANAYSDAADSATLSAANGYTDTRIASVSAAADEGDANTLSAAQTYSDMASANALVQALAADIDTFIGLTDTPSGYGGKALQLVRVNVGENGLEFAPSGTGGGAIDNDYNGNSSEGQSSTSSSTYQQKLRLSVTSLPVGNYMLQWYGEGRNQSVGDAIEIRIQEDDTTTHAEIRYYSGDSGGTNWVDDFQPFTGHRVLATFSGSHTFDIDYRSLSSGTAEFRRARITLWRMN